VEGGGKPMVLRLTAGQRGDAPELIPLLEAGAVKRRHQGRPRRRPRRLVADRSYSSRPIRAYLRQHHIQAVIPKRKNERVRVRLRSALYRHRHVAEQTINRLKQYRRVATRYEKRAANYLAMVIIAAILMWL
jgi:transposase